MKIRVTESHPGEFSESRKVLESRFLAAIGPALDAAQAPLKKAATPSRGGEVDALEEITQHMVTMYKARTDQMLADIAVVLEQSSEK